MKSRLLQRIDYHKIEQVIERLTTIQQEIIIFPAGEVGKDLLRIMQGFGVHISAFGDNSADKIGKRIENLPILSFAEISENHRNAIILIGSRPYADEIIHQFLNDGFASDHIVFEEFAGYAAMVRLDISALLQKNSEKIQRVQALLSDKSSQDVLYGYLNYLQTFDAAYIQQIKSPEIMYFDGSLFRLSKHETVVDGGGYIGDTFSVFAQLAQSFDTYFLCEPISENMQKARTKLNGMKFSGCVRYFETALWDCDTSLNFDEHGAASSVQPMGITVAASPLYDLVEEKNVTMIKLDVEGSENKALLGARKTITRCRPKLAVCVYHYNNTVEHGSFDILDLPLLINQLCPDYRIYLRHYGSGLTDTVCYAL